MYELSYIHLYLSSSTGVLRTQSARSAVCAVCVWRDRLEIFERDMFMTNSQVHKYDTRTAGNYCVHSCRTNIKKFTIPYQGPRVWNCLSTSITNLSSFPTFKNKVLEFLLK